MRPDRERGTRYRTYGPEDGRDARMVHPLRQGRYPLLGVLFSRTFAVAAGMTAVLTVVTYPTLPCGGREVGIGLLGQLCSVVALAAHEPVLRWRALIGAFSCFWTTVTFLLAGSTYRYSAAGIGLFALVGARAPPARWDSGGCSTGAGGGVFGLVWLVLGALLMDACSQAIHVTNQAVIYDLVAAARSRVTTVYMTTFFFGGAVGLVGWIGARRHERRS